MRKHLTYKYRFYIQISGRCNRKALKISLSAEHASYLDLSNKKIPLKL